MAIRKNWTRFELLICLAYYSSLTKSQRRSPPDWVLQQLSVHIGRSAGSVSLRFANYNSVDPDFTDQGLRGMVGGGAHVQTIWNEISKNDGHLDVDKLLRVLASELALLTKET